MKFSIRHITLFVAVGLLAGSLASLHAQSDIKGDVYVLDPSKAFKAQLVASSGMTGDVVISMPTLSGTMLLTGTAGAQGGVDRSAYLFNIQYGAGTGNALGALITSTTPTTNASASGLDILATADGTGTATALKLRATGSTADNYALEIAAGGIKISATLPTAVSSSQPLVLEGGVVKIGTVGTLTGSGSANTIPVWTSGTALGNSMLSQNGAGTVFTVTGRETITATTNQLVLGTTNTTTLSATAPAASRTYTMPDAGADALFVLTEGSRTINGPTTIDVGTGNNLTLSSNIATDASPLFLLTVNASNQVRRTTPGGVVWLTTGNTGITNTNNIVGIAETNANPLRIVTNNFDRVLISSAGDLTMPNTNHPTTGGRASISSNYTSLTGEAFAFQSATTFNNVATPGAGTFFGSQNNTILLTNAIAIPHLVGTRNRLAIQNSSSTIPNASMFLSDFSGRASGVAFTSFAAFRSKIALASHTGVGAYNLTGLLLEGPNNDGLMHTNVSYTGIRVDTIPSGTGTRRVFFYNGVAGDEVLISRTGVVALGTTAPAATSKLEVNGTAGTPNVRFTSLSGTAKASTPSGFDRVILANTNGDLDNVALTTLVGAVIPNGTVTDQTLRWNGTAWVANSTVLASAAGVVSATSASLSATTNQLVLGTTTTTTLNAVAPAANAVYTIPDVGAAASFVMTAGAQTIAGVKTFSSAPNLSSLTASLPLKLDASNNITAAAINLASATEVTGALPINRGGTNSATALNSNRIMVSSGGAIVEAAALTNGQLLIGSTGAAPAAAALTAGSGITVTNGAGSITIAATNPMPAGTTNNSTIRYNLATTAWVENTNVTATAAGVMNAVSLGLSATTNQLVLGTTTTTTINATTPAASAVYTIPDVGAAASFVMNAGAQTIAGVKTFSSAPNLSSLTASLPLKLDASKNITAAAIDLTSATEVTGALPINRGGTNSATALSNNRIMVSSGGAIVEAAALTNGQLLIGSTGAAPVAASLIAGSGITITPAAGSITIATSGWALTGNAGLTDNTNNYLGTTDAQPIYFITGSGGPNKRMTIGSTGLIGMNTTPLATYTLALQGNVKMVDATTSTISANKELVLEQTGDVYGTSRLRLQHRNGSNGALFETVGTVDLVDFGFKPNAGVQSNIRLEARTSSMINSTANTSGEFQFLMASTTTPVYALTLGQGSATFNAGVVGIGDPTPDDKFTVGTTSQFRVSSTGDITRIRDIAYTWPAAHAAGVLTNNGTGTMSWTPGTTVPAGTVTDQTLRWSGTAWVTNSTVTASSVGVISSTATTNQLVLGTTRTITVSAVTPATSSRVYTMADAGADASFVMTAGAQTIAGAKTLSSALSITPTTNQLVLGTTTTTTINAAAPAASAVYTISDVGTTGSFVMTEGTQTINGNKTISGATSLTGVATAKAGIAIRFENPLGTFSTGFAAGAQTANVTYTLPTTIATANQILRANGTTPTNLEWATVSTVSNGTTSNSTLFWNGTSWTENTNVLSPSTGNMSVNTLTSRATTNQLVLGTSTTVTINSPVTAANRVYSLPVLTADASFVMTEGAQTLNGVKTFSSGVPITATTNQLVLGTTNTATISATAPGASRTYTIADPGANASFVMTEGAQTLNGVKTFSSGVPITATTNQLVLGTTNTATISATAPSASRTYTIVDPGANASFVMTEGAQTINGAKTLSSALTVTPTTNQLVLGTTNTVTINAAAPAASRVYTIPAMSAASSFIMTEGAGFSTYAVGDIIYASSANTLSKLPIGTAGQVLTVSGGVPVWTTPVGTVLLDRRTTALTETAAIGTFTTGLSVTGVANKVYTFDGVIDMNRTTDLNFDVKWTAPAGTTIIYTFTRAENGTIALNVNNPGGLFGVAVNAEVNASFNTDVPNAVNGNIGNSGYDANAEDATPLTHKLTASATRNRYFVKGLVIMGGTGGTVGLQFSKNGGAVGNNVTMNIGSYVILTQTN